ncbi:MAG: sensor histidine kinase [Hyphomonas sp.]
MSPLASQKRLQIIHLIWVGLIISAIFAGALAGMSASSLVVCGAGAVLPGLIGAFLLSHGGLGNRNTEAFLIICWTLLAVIAVAVTGSISSPLTILFAIAPLLALNFFSEKMAVEATFFGVLAYFSMALMGMSGLLSVKTQPTLPFAMALVVSALVLTGLLVFTLLQRHAGARDMAMAGTGKQNGKASFVPHEEQTIVHLPPDLPEHSGVMLLDVAGHGRITRVVGDRLGLGGVYPGVVLSSLFGVDTSMDDLSTPSSKSVGPFVLANGRKVRAQIEAAGEHRRVLLVDISEMQSAIDEAKTGEANSLKGLRERTAFFASLGHELKTPLNAILGYADMMRAGIRGPMPDAYADYPDIIHESGQDLLLLVEDILDLAKADANKLRLEMEPVDLAASAKSVMRQLENQAERAGVDLQMNAEGEVWANADARAVRQIWQNLVSNAIKYSNRSGQVVLAVQVYEGMAQMSVTDFGVGMSEIDIKRILEPFAQGENARGRAGTGLGLAVVSSFAKLQGGDVSIRSRENEGTSVTVSLPLADPIDVLPLGDEAE